MTIVTTVSTAGSLAIQYEASAPNTPVRGALIRYADDTVIGLDYATQTYSKDSLKHSLERSRAERGLVLSATAVPEIGPSRLLRNSSVIGSTDGYASV
jgi:hypothetical protein